MHVFIAGATGVLGRRLVRELVERGHRVTGLARSRKGAERVRRLGGRPAAADLFDPAALARAARGAEVVIHAATAIPLRPGRSLAAWAMNDRIRREGTAALTAAAARVGARRYLQQSVVWVRGGTPGRYDERTPPAPTPVVRSAVDGERLALAGGEAHGFTATVLRCGAFYGPDVPHTHEMAAMLARGRLPVVGRGDSVLAPLHVDDAAAAFATAAEQDAPGIWHIVDDAPLPVGEFLDGLARRLGGPRPRRVPVWLARLLAGGIAVEFFTASMDTTNRPFADRLGWTPRYPTVWTGVERMVAEWKRHDGGLGVTAGNAA